MLTSIVPIAAGAAVVLHFAMRVLNSGQMATLLAKFGLPPIPSKYIPWISVATGTLAGLASALAGGMSLPAALDAIFAGLAAGTGAIAIHETAGQLGTGAQSDATPPSPPSGS